jgi:hypothetical protein
MSKKLWLLVLGAVLLLYGFVFMIVPLGSEIQLAGLPIFCSGGIILFVVGLDLALQPIEKREEKM